MSSSDVESLARRDLLEERIDLDELVVVHDVPHERDGEYRLDAARAAGDDAERSRRRDRRRRRVAHLRSAFLVVDAPLEGREGAALLGERDARRARLALDEAHDLLGDLERLLRIVRDLELDEHVGETHDAEADLAVPERHLADLLERIAVHVDDVVEEAHRFRDDVAELLEIDARLAAAPLDHVREVDRTEIARFVREQRLLAARIRALDRRRAAASD